MDENGNAKLLFTGVNRAGDGGMGHTWTLVRALCISANYAIFPLSSLCHLIPSDVAVLQASAFEPSV